MNSSIIGEFKRRRDLADKVFHNRLRALMRVYNIPINQLNEIAIINHIDSIQEARHDMIHWNEQWRDEVRRDETARLTS